MRYKNKERYKNSFAENNEYKPINKFDAYDDPDFSYYKNQVESFKKKDKVMISEICQKLKVNAEPFFPKKLQDTNKDTINKIDLSNIKEYEPKNYKIVKKE